MKRRRYIFLALFFALLAAWPAASLSSPATANADARVTPAVWAQLDARGQADVIILLTQPDLSPAYALPDKAARGRWVYDALRAAANSAQAPLLAELNRAGASYQRFWAVNAIQARVDGKLLARLLRFSQVQRVSDNAWFAGVGPEPPAPVQPQAAAGAIPWGVGRVQAPWAWEQGFTGAGVVVAGQDTGYDWTHEALQRAYRGYDASTGVADHDYNWHDAIHEIDPHLTGSNPCGLDAPAPCDDYGHGTHTMGTMAGNDLTSGEEGWPAAAAHPIGVAPGAKWMACRNMERGWGRPSTYIECFQWLTAPWPAGGDPFADGDPTKAPDVMNNSWSCLIEEGCTPDKLSVIEPALDAADAAGILVVDSAQNNGPECGSIREPVAIYPRAFSVGATSSGDALASFSGRGPVRYKGVTRSGPNVSGPGVSVMSSIPGNGYRPGSGTSMAGPHVAGVAALLISAEPALRGQTGMLRAIISRTADPKTSSQGCSGDAADAIPNNGFGWGVVNARSAIESLSQEATITGQLQDAGGNPIAEAGVIVRVYRQPGGELAAQGVTDATGAFHIDIPWGVYLLTARAAGGRGMAGLAYAVGGRALTVDLTMLPQQIFLPLTLAWQP